MSKREWLRVPVPGVVSPDGEGFTGWGLLETDEAGGRILATVLEDENGWTGILTKGPNIPPQPNLDDAKRYCELVLGLELE